MMPRSSDLRLPVDKVKSVKNSDRQQVVKARQALSASISAEALQVHAEQVEVPRRCIEFTITDILPVKNQKTSKKVDQLTPSSPTVREPLSLPRPGRNSATFVCNNTEQSPPAAPKAMKQETSSPASSSERYAEFLEQAENTELFAYTSALCHRVTGRYLPRTLLQNDPQAQQRELERVQRDPEILRAIDSVRVLSAQFKNVAQDTMGHRRELGHTLIRIEESYLKLFEKLLELSLRLYWEYEQRTEGQRREDRASIERWREQYERKSAECVRANKRLAAREIIHRAREVEVEDYRGQLREIERELTNQRGLEAQIFQLQNAAALQRVLEQKLQDDYMQLKKKHEEIVEFNKQQREEFLAQQKDIINGLRKTVREKQRFISKQEVTLRQLEEVASVVPAVVETRSSQTEVDDDGLWDAQDGVPRFVSKSVLHKMMWRRFNAFVACKNCGGRPLPKSAKTNPYGRGSYEAGSEEVDVWSVDKGKKHTKKTAKRVEQIEQQWYEQSPQGFLVVSEEEDSIIVACLTNFHLRHNRELPSHTVLFLSNLPKSVVAFPFYSLEHVVAQIEAIYDDKFTSDKTDEADGVAREELPRFICEYFLRTHGLRQSAEIGLYRFLISVKNTYQRSSHVRLFARFSNLLNSQDEVADDSLLPESSNASQKKQKTTAPDEKLVFRKTKRLGYLDRSFLRVFLVARHYLLRAPPQASPKIKQIHRHGEAGAGSANRSLATEHVVQVDTTKMWVALDHAIKVLRWYINCLSEDSISEYCRQVEYNTAIYDGQRIVEIAGNRLAVRAEMRRVMLASEKPDDASSSSFSQDDTRPLPPRIVADVHKVLSLLMTALEQRRESIKKDLTALFDSGDVNHDCVLTLDEFSAIIRMRKPHFSDRRILRMFREALMGGVDQSFALSMDAFVIACNDHGLVSLLPDDRMTDPFASIASVSPIVKSSKQKAGVVQQTESSVDIPSSNLADIPEDINLDGGNVVDISIHCLREQNM